MSVASHQTPIPAGVASYRVGDLTIDLGSQRVMRGEDEISLPKLSFDLLLALVRAAPNLVSLDGLMHEVWPNLVVGPETVSQRVKLLRDALGDDPRAPRYIEGLRGRGYRLIAPVSRVATVLSEEVREASAPASDLPQRRASSVGAASLVDFCWSARNSSARGRDDQRRGHAHARLNSGLTGARFVRHGFRVAGAHGRGAALRESERRSA